MPSFHDQRQVYHPDNATETQEVERMGKAGSWYLECHGSALGARDSRDLVRIRKDQGLFPRASQVRFIFQTPAATTHRCLQSIKANGLNMDWIVSQIRGVDIFPEETQV